MRIATILGAAFLLLAACGDDDTSSSGTGGSATGTGAAAPTSSGTLSTGTSGDGDGDGDGDGGSAPSSSSTLSGGGGEGGAFDPNALRSFRYGINMGWQPNQPGAADMAFLANQAGVNSNRPKFSPDFFDEWGIGVELPKFEAAAAEGIRHNVGFLIGSSVGKTTSPDGSNLEHHIPTNLHVPIWNDDGSVNEDNHWAVFVRDVVTTYKDHVEIWEVWNEPDWVSDWNHTLTWDTEPPTKEQLVRFGGDIFDYVRMLRISSEVAKSVDPGAKIAVGGLGYATFLSAILRYTDAPGSGAVDAEHPETGAAYFDVVSYHFYPVFSSEQMSASDKGVDGFIGTKTAMQEALDAAGVGDDYGWVVTENGAPHIPIEIGGSEAFARNFLIKSMVVAQVENIRSVQWFCMTDGTEQTSEFSRMGLYQALSDQTRETATRTALGSSYRTLRALHDAQFDPSLTTSLALGAGARGGAFRFEDGRRAYVLWARTEDGETGAATATIFADGDVTVGEWDSGETGATSTLTASGGELVVDLVGSPRIFVEQ